MLKISKAQVGHALAGLVLIPAATAVSAWLLKHFPGLPHFSAEQIAIGAYGVGAAAAGLALHYLKGLREWQKLEAEGLIAVDEVATGDTLDPRLHGHPIGGSDGSQDVGDAGRAYVSPADDLHRESQK